MPNTPALVGCGATVFSRGSNASEKDAQLTEKLFSAVGFCEEVPENMIDPVTALAGSGPAYVSAIKKQDSFFLMINSKNIQKFYKYNFLLLKL